MTFSALRAVAAGLKGVSGKAIGGRLAAGLKEGATAGKLGEKIFPIMADDIGVSPGTITRMIKVAPDSTGASAMVPYNMARGERIINATRAGNDLDKALNFADGIETVAIPGMTVGDLAQNLVARFGNAMTTPPAQANIMGTAIGVGLGQNPLVALGSNVGGNYAGRVAGNLARKTFGLGADSVRAGTIENLVNFGVSYQGGNILGGMLGGGEQPTSATEQEAQMRQTQSQMLSQRQMPSNGGMRQMADLQGASGAYQRPLPPEGRSLQMADRPSMVMADIPPLDAATADKLRKRAIENAQGNIFSATQLGSYMEGM